MLVREDIRQHLIFEDNQTNFLRYMREFKQSCFEEYSKNLYSDDCAQSILHKLDIPDLYTAKIDDFLIVCSGKS